VVSVMNLALSDPPLKIALLFIQTWRDKAGTLPPVPVFFIPEGSFQTTTTLIEFG